MYTETNMKTKKITLLLPLTLLFGLLGLFSVDKEQPVSATYEGVSPYTCSFADSSIHNVINASGGSFELNGVTWNYGAANYLAHSNTYGIQVGSGSAYQVDPWTVTADISDFGNYAVKSITVYTHRETTAYTFKLKIGCVDAGNITYDVGYGDMIDTKLEFAHPRSFGTIFFTMSNVTNVGVFVQSISIELVPAITNTITISEHTEHNVVINNNVNSKIRYKFDTGVVSVYTMIPGDLTMVSVSSSTAGDILYVSDSYISNVASAASATFVNNTVRITSADKNFFYLIYDGVINTLTYTYIPDSDLLMTNFIDHYLHMHDYNSNLGLCKSEYFTPLMNAYNNLTSEEKQAISDNEAAQDRLNAWMDANGYKLEGNEIVKKINTLITTSDNNHSLVIILITSILLFTICTLFVYKKKQ